MSPVLGASGCSKLIERMLELDKVKTSGSCGPLLQRKYPEIDFALACLTS